MLSESVPRIRFTSISAQSLPPSLPCGLCWQLGRQVRQHLLLGELATRGLLGASLCSEPFGLSSSHSGYIMASVCWVEDRGAHYPAIGRAKTQRCSLQMLMILLRTLRYHNPKDQTCVCGLESPGPSKTMRSMHTTDHYYIPDLAALPAHM